MRVKRKPLLGILDSACTGSSSIGAASHAHQQQKHRLHDSALPRPKLATKLAISSSSRKDLKQQNSARNGKNEKDQTAPTRTKKGTTCDDSDNSSMRQSCKVHISPNILYTLYMMSQIGLIAWLLLFMLACTSQGYFGSSGYATSGWNRRKICNFPFSCSHHIAPLFHNRRTTCA
jgi:hypothetical protein